MKIKTCRLLLGLIIAPFFPALIVFLIESSLAASSDTILYHTYILGILGYIATLTVGMPLYLILKIKNLHTFKNYVLICSILAALFPFVIDFPHYLSLDKIIITNHLLGFVYAFVVSSLFWIIQNKKIHK